MGLRYENLDPETRTFMVEEITMDTADQSMYVSNYLNERGAAAWPALTLEAAKTGTDDSLARELSHGLLKETAERRKPKGGTTMVKVPVTAPHTLAEAQFNMYYMRALARRAIASQAKLTVYRAKNVEHPRAESEAMIGTQIDPNAVLKELRCSKGVEPSIKIPLPNSGLCVRLS